MGKSGRGVNWRAALWVSLLTTVICGSLAWVAALDYMEVGLASMLGLSLTSHSAVSKDVAIVLVDAGSGGLPDDRFVLRGKFGEFLEQLYQCEPPPQVIAFDYYFEGDGESPDEIEATRQFADAIAAAPRDTSIVVGLGDPSERLASGEIEEWVAEFEESIIGSVGKPSWGLVRGGSQLGVIDRAFGAMPGSAGTDVVYPGFSVRVAVGRSQGLDLRAQSLRADGYDIPLDRDGYMRMQFPRAPVDEEHPVLSELLEASEVGRERRQGLAGKRVIVASKEEGLQLTPLGDVHPAMIYAYAASGILDKTLLRPWPFWCLLIVVFVLSGVTSLVFRSQWGGTTFRFAGLLGLAICPPVGLALVAEGAWGIITEVTYPVVSVFLAAFVVSRLTPDRVATLSEHTSKEVAEAVREREPELATTAEQTVSRLEQARARISKRLQGLDTAVQRVIAGDRPRAWLLMGMCLALFAAYMGFLCKAWSQPAEFWKSALGTLAGTTVFGALAQWPFRQVRALFVGDRELQLAVPVLRVQLEAATSEKKCRELAAEIDERFEHILGRCRESAEQNAPRETDV